MSAPMHAPAVTRIEHADGPVRPASSWDIGATSTAKARASATSTKADAGFGFSDFLDTINPLQQLPIVGTLYRAVTGDEISQEAHYAGSALYGLALGGPIGMGAMVGMAIAEDVVSDHFSSADTAVATATDEVASPETMVIGDLPVSKPAGPETFEMPPELASTAAAGSPLDLFQWLRPEAASVGQSFEMTSEPFSPANVTDVAAHPDNHLPLSVLEALRQRHMGLLDNEPT